MVLITAKFVILYGIFTNKNYKQETSIYGI